MNFAQTVINVGTKGERMHPIDGETVHDIPAHACRGRSGRGGKTFSGFLDEERGELRFDCVEDPEFYLCVDLEKVPSIACRPGGPAAAEARDEFVTLAAASPARL